MRHEATHSRHILLLEQSQQCKLSECTCNSLLRRTFRSIEVTFVDFRHLIRIRYFFVIPKQNELSGTKAMNDCARVKGMKVSGGYFYNKKKMKEGHTVTDTVKYNLNKYNFIRDRHIYFARDFTAKNMSSICSALYL